MSGGDSGIPHIREDRRIADFFAGALQVEFIDDIGDMKPGATGDTEYARHLEEALAYVVRERPWDPDSFARMTGVGFWEDEEPYASRS